MGAAGSLSYIPGPMQLGRSWIFVMFRSLWVGYWRGTAGLMRCWEVQGQQGGIVAGLPASVALYRGHDALQGAGSPQPRQKSAWLSSY
jgi:hypothetical protein